MRRRRALAFGSALLLLCVSACSRLGNQSAASTPPGAPVMIFDRSGRDSAAFSSPNNNISCGFEASTKAETYGMVRCEITVKSWQSPPKPQSCSVDWGTGISLDGRAAVGCVDSTLRGEDGLVQLPFGTSIRFAPFTCSSEPNGVDCVNADTGAGFLIGQDGYELRNP